MTPVCSMPTCNKLADYQQGLYCPEHMKKYTEYLHSKGWNTSSKTTTYPAPKRAQRVQVDIGSLPELSKFRELLAELYGDDVVNKAHLVLEEGLHPTSVSVKASVLTDIIKHYEETIEELRQIIDGLS